MTRLSFLTAAVLLTTVLPSFAAKPTTKNSYSQSSTQALTYATEAITAMTSGATINDVTITGNVTWSGTDSGSATLQALGRGESRIDLTVSGGARTEIRDVQTGISLGKWVNANGASGYFAPQNCWTDAVWFFPVLGSLAAGPNVVLSYIGQEDRNGASVQHLQSRIAQTTSGPSPTPQQLSVMDFYLDATTLLPVAITYNEHPDKSMTTNLLVEVDFSNYQNVNGITLPTHIQRLQQGTEMIDLTVSGATFNTGLQLSAFAIH